MYYVLYIGRDSKLKDLRTTLAKEKIKGSFRVKKLRKKHVYNYDQTLKLVRDYRYIYDFVIIDTGSLDYFTVADLIRGLLFLYIPHRRRRSHI